MARWRRGSMILILIIAISGWMVAFHLYSACHESTPKKAFGDDEEKLSHESTPKKASGDGEEKLSHEFTPKKVSGDGEEKLSHDSCRILLRSLYSKRLIPSRKNTFFSAIMTFFRGDEDPSEDQKSKKFLARLFNNKKNGTFFEAGGHNGYFFSNTYFFEKTLGWSGIMVEPSRNSFEKMLNSGRDIWASNACISDRWEGISCEIREFQEHVNPIDWKSGGASSLSRGYRPPFNDGGRNNKYRLICFPLDEFLEMAGISKNLDLLSLDVQGAEIGILETMDWSKVDIKVILVELETPKNLKRVPPFLEEKGYVKIEKLNRDFVYVQKSLLTEFQKNLKNEEEG
ncbi:unnamed protein product [Cyprideis torosa]|uniref:Methyltransferase FkbM domain-containing protein n=1 Tax=Cyprideis torosa TaxID=163714 RepID=A0A7R8ZLI2_9CRUS|nr:unnamed protein product [Cyprideis torosa]CAG0893242.1 unnamed protein product [Cyprideis torosa]